MSKASEAALKAYPNESFIDESYADMCRSFYEEGYEQAEEDLANVAAFSSGPDGFYYGKGYQQGKSDAEKHLGWHSAEESLPPVDEEVIVLTDVVNSDYPENKIDGANFMCFGHIVDPDAIVDVYGNPYKIVEYNGWNIPGVKYWMPMPKLPEEK